MLKAHEALHTFVTKQMKVDKVRASHKEEIMYVREEKAEEERTRKEERTKLRKKLAHTKQERIRSAIERKEERFLTQDGGMGMSASSAQGRVWRDLAVKDQKEKIERMDQIQKVYKERLIEQMYVKEAKYDKI